MIISDVQIAFLPPFDSVLALIEKNIWHLKQYQAFDCAV